MNSPEAWLRVARALAELRALRSSDPAATAANEAVLAAASTLEFFWLPALANARSVDACGSEPVDLGTSEQPRQPDGR